MRHYYVSNTRNVNMSDTSKLLMYAGYGLIAYVMRWKLKLLVLKVSEFWLRVLFATRAPGKYALRSTETRIQPGNSRYLVRAWYTAEYYRALRTCYLLLLPTLSDIAAAAAIASVGHFRMLCSGLCTGRTVEIINLLLDVHARSLWILNLQSTVKPEIRTPMDPQRFTWLSDLRNTVRPMDNLDHGGFVVSGKGQNWVSMQSCNWRKAVMSLLWCSYTIFY